jgi:hypothetical protein
MIPMWESILTFPFPPPVPYDVSEFRRLALRIRLGQSITDSPVRIAAVLYSTNIKNDEYAFPTYDLNNYALTQQWRDISMPLAEFGHSFFVNYDLTLDLRGVYRFALLLRGLPRATIHGYIDVGDIRFRR